MRFIEWVVAKLNGWFKRKKPELLQPDPKPVAQPLPRPDPTAAEVVMAKILKPGGESPANRAARRRLERLRRKHDKFVTPKGPKPVKVERDPAPPKPLPQPAAEPPAAIPSPVTEANIWMIDKHHEDRAGADVLYEESELFGVFNFRDTILQQLELYFVYLERMKRRDADSYEFYKQVGAVVVPYLANNAHHRFDDDRKKEPIEPVPLSPWFNKTRPSFGCFVYGADPETEKYEREKPAPPVNGHKTEWWVPKFLYYTKYTQPPPEFEQMSGGDVYKMTIWWDKPYDKKFAKRHKNGVPQDFGIFINKDGSKVTVLRVIETKYVPVRSRKRFSGYTRHPHEIFEIPQRLWQIPEIYTSWARENHTDVQVFMSNLFIESARSLELAQTSMIRVAASKKDATAIFGVDVERMAYFFQDRDYHLTEDGHRKKIFHMVRPHRRKDGTYIKFHFRGEREFTWAGYRVSITVPGRDHYVMDEFDVGGHDEYWMKGQKVVDMKQLGARIAKDIRCGFGGMR